MWFGNLVTMKWWSDLYLNEGFASYIEFKGINAAYPEWKMVTFIFLNIEVIIKCLNCRKINLQSTQCMVLWI